jgi:C4-dicarboxylate transporter, DctM subunit
MSELALGLLYGGATLAVMFSGVPIATALGVVAVVFMYIFMPLAALDTVTRNVYEEIANITLLSIPLFIVKGSLIGRSRAGQDLYRSLHAFMRRIPGGLGIANIFACGLFAAMAGSSPATCSAIGSAGIPEMRTRGYSGALSAGIIAAGGTLGILLPPSITMILYAVAAEVSLGQLFLAGIVPAALLMTLFSIYTCYAYWLEHRRALAAERDHGLRSPFPLEPPGTFREKVMLLPRVLPFMILLIGVMVALYGGYATPAETAGLGAMLALGLIAIIYGVWRPSQLRPILSVALRESVMIMFIIGMSLLYSYVMSFLHISQSAAEWIVHLHLSKWALLATILSMVIVLGFFLPPVSVILMTAPIILPALKVAGFNLVWFGVVMTIIMEMGLIHPPVGMNLFIINNIAPDIPLRDIMWGTLPFILLLMISTVLICVFPSIALWLPTTVMSR